MKRSRFFDPGVRAGALPGIRWDEEDDGTARPWRAGDTLSDRVQRTGAAALADDAVFSSFPPPPPEIVHRAGAVETAVRDAFLALIRERGCTLEPTTIDSCMRAVRRSYHGKVRQYRADLTFLVADGTVLLQVEVDEVYHHPEPPGRLNYLAYDAGATTHIVLRLHTGPIPGQKLGQKRRPAMLEEAYDDDEGTLRPTREFPRRINLLVDAFMAYLAFIDRGGCSHTIPYARIVKSIGWH